jgi:AraC-like DNA-binding protein
MWWKYPAGYHLYWSRGPSSSLGRIFEAGMLPDSVGPPKGNVLGRYALVYSLAGSARYEDGQGRVRDVEPGDVILVFPELAQWYYPKPGARWREFFIVFEGPLFDVWRKGGLLSPERPFAHCEPVTYWLERLHTVVGAPESRTFVPPLVQVCRLQEILGEMLAGTGSDAPVAFIAKACALLETDQRTDVSGVARKLGVSYETFRRRFRETMGISPARYRSARLIERACDMMRTGNLTDKEISRVLGFCDEYHFSRRFKQIEGASPRVFRKRLAARGHAKASRA